MAKQLLDSSGRRVLFDGGRRRLIGEGDPCRCKPVCEFGPPAINNVPRFRMTFVGVQLCAEEIRTGRLHSGIHSTSSSALPCRHIDATGSSAPTSYANIWRGFGMSTAFDASIELTPYAALGVGCSWYGRASSLIDGSMFTMSKAGLEACDCSPAVELEQRNGTEAYLVRTNACPNFLTSNLECFVTALDATTTYVVAAFTFAEYASPTDAPYRWLAQSSYGRPGAGIHLMGYGFEGIPVFAGTLSTEFSGRSEYVIPNRIRQYAGFGIPITYPVAPNVMPRSVYYPYSAWPTSPFEAAKISGALGLGQPAREPLFNVGNYGTADKPWHTTLPCLGKDGHCILSAC